MPLNMDEPKQCRICFEPETNTCNPLVSPCDCSGSQAFVHLECLNKWIQISGNATCGVCTTRFKVRRRNNSEKRYRKLNAIVLSCWKFSWIVLTCALYIAIFSEKAIATWFAAVTAVVMMALSLAKVVIDMNQRHETDYVLEIDGNQISNSLSAASASELV